MFYDNACTYIYACIYIYIQHVCMYVIIALCTSIIYYYYICKYVNVCMYACMYACMYVYILHMQACMHVVSSMH